MPSEMNNLEPENSGLSAAHIYITKPLLSVEATHPSRKDFSSAFFEHADYIPLVGKSLLVKIQF